MTSATARANKARPKPGPVEKSRTDEILERFAERRAETKEDEFSTADAASAQVQAATSQDDVPGVDPAMLQLVQTLQNEQAKLMAGKTAGFLIVSLGFDGTVVRPMIVHGGSQAMTMMIGLIEEAKDNVIVAARNARAAEARARMEAQAQAQAEAEGETKQ